ncbi:MAG TPA: hypothetical protein VFJ47_13125 [Terriglobales bacterium]|nr:hypothetical protein [Terriglobales bacterium]
MASFGQPSPANDQRETNWTAIGIGVGIVIVIVGVIAFFSRSQPGNATPPHPYTANLKISDLKMSAAENFVGASVTYVDGRITNTGEQTVIHAVVRVVFKNSLGQVVGDEYVPLHVLQTGGPYPDTVDLNLAPLSAGQSKPFRLTFEHISSDWNQQIPELQVSDVAVK